MRVKVRHKRPRIRTDTEIPHAQQPSHRRVTHALRQRRARGHAAGGVKGQRGVAAHAARGAKDQDGL